MTDKEKAMKAADSAAGRRLPPTGWNSWNTFGSEFAAELTSGCDIRKADPYTKDLLMNRDLISVLS